MKHMFSSRSIASFSTASMIKKIRRWIVAAVTIVAIFGSMSAMPVLAVSLQQDINQQLTTTGNTVYGGTGQPQKLSQTVGKIIQGLLGMIGVLAIVLIIYAGFLWMTAQGDEDKVDKAKDILREAVIGLIIIFLAYGIANFIIDAVVNTSGAAP